MAAAYGSDAISPISYKIFDEKFRRIVEEGYELAFGLCNYEMEEFSSSKIFDIFTQVFPTGYVLDTAYWPFYSSVTGNCLCICRRFRIPCRHVKSGRHWINMQPVEHERDAIVFYPRYYGPVTVESYDITITPVDIGGTYEIQMVFHVHYLWRERESRSLNTPHFETYPVRITFRFYTINQYYPSMVTIAFHPSPFYSEDYGIIFKNLKQRRDYKFGYYYGQYQQTWCVSYDHMSTMTFLPYKVYVPEFRFLPRLPVYNYHSAVMNRPTLQDYSTRYYFPTPAFNCDRYQDVTICEDYRYFATISSPEMPEDDSTADSIYGDSELSSDGHSEDVYPNPSLSTSAVENLKQNAVSNPVATTSGTVKKSTPSTSMTVENLKQNTISNPVATTSGTVKKSTPSTSMTVANLKQNAISNPVATTSGTVKKSTPSTSMTVENLKQNAIFNPVATTSGTVKKSTPSTSMTVENLKQNAIFNPVATTSGTVKKSTPSTSMTTLYTAVKQEYRKQKTKNENLSKNDVWESDDSF